jgi:hypothetical protein
MTVPLDLQSELFSATGGAAAEGVSNQLGRPRADRFTLLIREAVQNSWDARLASGGVHFQVEGYLLDRAARRVLATEIFAKAPHAVDIRARLLDERDFHVLAVSDYGTRGLGGPTRGDVVPAKNESTNFVDFMRYIGRTPNRAYSGGTYGFGKAAYFLASSLKTICVHTRFSNGHGVETRFMGAALGPQFETSGPGGRRFTGRHWWGTMASDEVVDPVTGTEADELAALLGGSQRTSNATGTTVYVLAPDFEGARPELVLSNMGRAITDYFWPKLVDGPDQTPTMSFGIRWQGDDLPLPNVLEEPDLALLVRAFAVASARQPSGGAVMESIASQRPKKLLGHLALLRQPTASMGSSALTADADDSGASLYQPVLRRPLRHVALMRAPNFVVKYLEGPAVPYELVEYAGVFRVHEDVDAAFARAEPPTHDDWIPDLLVDASEKTHVRVAVRRLREVVEKFAAPPPIDTGGGESQSVAGFSRLLGGLVPSLAVDGSRATSANRSDGGNSRRAGGTRRKSTPVAQIDFVGEPSTELVDGVPAMVARFQVSSHSGGSFRVTGLPKVVVADGFENEPPEGAQQPAILKWIGPDSAVVGTNTSECEIPPSGGVWTVVVSIPSDAMISLALRAEATASA